MPGIYTAVENISISFPALIYPLTKQAAYAIVLRIEITSPGRRPPPSGRRAVLQEVLVKTMYHKRGLKTVRKESAGG
jgi:hypothetical protein